jgi:hypothetical protein
VSDSPDQAAHYHTLIPQLGASSLTGHVAGLRVTAFLYTSFYMGGPFAFVSSVSVCEAGDSITLHNKDEVARGCCRLLIYISNYV